MATIGSITIEFAADLLGLREGIEESLDLFEELADSIDTLSEQLDDVSSSTVKIKTEVDAKAIAKAGEDVKSLSDGATVKVGVDATAATASVSRLAVAIASVRQSITQFAGVSGSASQEVRRFADNAGTTAEANESLATSLRRTADAYLLSGTGQAAKDAKQYADEAAKAGAVTARAETALKSSASAARGLAEAATLAASGDVTLTSAIDKTIIAVGRSRDAYIAGGTAIGTAATSLGGYATVSAAVAGSSAATAISIGSLAGAIAGGTTSLLVYSGIMAATRAATAGLSDESKKYVEAATQVGAVGIAAAAGVRVSAAAYGIVATALYRSSSAMEFFQRVIGGVSSSVTQAASRVGVLSTSFSNLLPAIELVVGASNKDVSLAQYAALTTRVVATSAALGAAGGALSAFAAGEAVAGAAAAGAVSSIGGLAAAFPLVAPAAIGAAVATGRFAHELEHLSLAAQATDQMASRFGSSQEAMSKLRLAAQNTNVSMGQLAKGQQAFYTNLNKVKIGQLNVDSVREAKLAYDRLDISINELKNDSPEEAFKKVAKALSEVEDPAKRTSLAFDLFGKQGAAILPALKEVGELEADFQRLGGALTQIDFQRFLTLETSFDRIKAASGNLGQTMLIPFVELQKAFNNISADIQGGLSAALTPLMGVLADVTKPLAVVIELFGRVLNIMLRIAGIVGTVAAGFLDFAFIADIVEAAGDAFLYMLIPIETTVSVLEKIASVIAGFLRPAMNLLTKSTESVSQAVFNFGKAVSGAIVGAIVSLTAFNLAMQSTAVQAVVNAAITYAAIGVGLFGGILALIPVVVGGLAFYAAAWITSAATALAAGITMGVAWLLAMGPVGAVILGVLAVGAAFAGLYAIGGEIYDLFSGIAGALGFTSVKEEIDAATASTEELAAAAEEASKPAKQKAAEAVSKATATSETVQVDFGGENTAQASFDESRAAAVEFGMSIGLTADQAEAAIKVVEDSTKGLSGWISKVSAEYAESFKGPSREELTASIDAARGKMGELTIEAARFGEAGADAVMKSTDDFNDLQKELAGGKITLEEFDEQSAKLAEKLEDNLKILRDDSPQITLKKNLELYKKLDDAVKEAGKSVRDIAAGTVIDGKLFPASETVKANAEKYKNEYAAALDAIKKKQQSGGFAKELKVKREDLQSDFDSGKISKEEFTTRKLELDTTSAQEQASIAGEEAKREFDRNFKKIGEDVSFAENIRKELETAFLSPVQKFEKELKKVKDNKSLTASEKILAESNLRKQATESLVGKNAQGTFQERTRDLKQAAESGLIGEDKLKAELQKAAEDFASAVGVTKTPFETFSSSLNNIASQFGFAGQPLDVVREKLKGNAEQLAMFDRAVKESRDNLLQSLGIEKSPQQILDDQLKKIDEAVNAKDPNKRITAKEAEQARATATRKRDEALGAGADVGGQLRERQAKIDEAFGGGKDPARMAIAQNKLDMDKRSAAGLDATPAQALKAGVDKINDAFGVTGKSMAEVRASLSPAEFKEYEEAIKKNSDAVKANLGVEKNGADKIAEARTKLEQAVKDGVITEAEKNKAMKEQRDSFLSSLGIPKSPAQDFEDAVQKIKDNASELNPEEMAKGLKEAKDKLLSSLGIDKSPAEQATESMKKLREAFDKGQISAEEFAKGSQKAKDSLLQSLGIPLDPVTQLRERMNDLNEAFDSGLISQEEFTRGQEEAKRSMLPGGEAESPVKKFERDMKSIEQAASEGLISDSELADRKKNLQAQLQEDLAPALDATKADRRGVEASDSRSKGGVDTFFRILRGNDNPSLKAQLEVARNTKILAEAAKNPDAAPVIAQLPAR